MTSKIVFLCTCELTETVTSYIRHAQARQTPGTEGEVRYQVPALAGELLAFEGCWKRKSQL